MSNLSLSREWVPPSSLCKPKEPDLEIRQFNFIHDLVSDSVKQMNGIEMAYIKVSVTPANIIGNI